MAYRVALDYSPMSALSPPTLTIVRRVLAGISHDIFRSRPRVAGDFDGHFPRERHVARTQRSLCFSTTA
jgi:hypothetical protein